LDCCRVRVHHTLDLPTLLTVFCRTVARDSRLASTFGLVVAVLLKPFFSFVDTARKRLCYVESRRSPFCVFWGFENVDVKEYRSSVFGRRKHMVKQATLTTLWSMETPDPPTNYSKWAVTTQKARTNACPPHLHLPSFFVCVCDSFNGYVVNLRFANGNIDRLVHCV